MHGLGRSAGAIAVAAMSFVMAGCASNTLSGPPRLVGAGTSGGSGIYGANGALITACSNQNDNGLNLVEDFVKRACASHSSPGDPALASLMMNAGITLNRVRCGDFFRQRGSGQTASRIARRSITPLSALITGVLGIINFSSDDNRQEALQILGLAVAATDGALSVYESEFLFSAENIRSVELLTMRDLDTHGQEILNRGSGFYQALRDLLDHQARCRPTNILQLAQTAIREGRIRSRDAADGDARTALAARDSATAATISQTFGLGSLSADQIGMLWWLWTDQNALTPNMLQVIRARLGTDLAALLITDNSGTLALSADASTILNGQSGAFGRLSVETRTLFQIRRQQLRAALSSVAAAAAVDRAKDIVFGLSTSERGQNAGAVETAVEPNE